MNPKTDIAVLGSLNADLVVTLDRNPDGGETVLGDTLQTYCGGKGANQAYAAAKLGAQVTMLGRVGDDDYGKRQIENLRSVGVSTDRVKADTQEPTGTAIITVDRTNENRIIVVPGANATFRACDLDEDRAILGSARFLLLQLETPLETVARAAQIASDAGACVVLDPAPAQPLPASTLGCVDYLTPNLAELRTLTGDPLGGDCSDEAIVASARRLCARGVRCVVAKLGGRGAMVVTAETTAKARAFSVQPVDTTAAGDCFNAAFATALSEDQAEEQALRFACAAAALSVTKAGAQPSMPTREAVNETLFA